MTDKITSLSRLVADDLRAAERSLEQAMLDVARFVATTIEAGREARKDSSVAARLTAPAIDAMTAVAAGQRHFNSRAHPLALALATKLGLTATDFGAGEGKDEGISLEEVPQALPA